MGKLAKQLDLDALGPTFSRPSPSTYVYSKFWPMFNASFFFFSKCLQDRLQDFTNWTIHVLFSSVAQSCLTLRPHGLQHARFPCPSPTPGACSNSCPSSQWCHPTISSSVIPFSSHLQSFPASGSLPMSQFFTSGGQSIRVSASALVLPMNIQDWFPLGLTGLISLWSKGLSRVVSNTKVQKHQLFGTQFSLSMSYF